ncbi:MAG: trypsin-like peptidase domain-containing protein [Flavobacteriaceae bacterium]
MKYFLFILLLTSLFQCSETFVPPNPEELFEDYRGSVVLIYNEYFYEIKTQDLIYYYSPDSEEKFFFSREDLENNFSVGFGTGFIISDKGEIITNRHVVEPENIDYKEAFWDFHREKYDQIVELVNRKNDSITILDKIILPPNPYDDPFFMDDYYNYNYELVNEARLKKEELIESINFYIGFASYIKEIDFENINPKLNIVSLRIAYDDTYVNKKEDLQECVFIRSSSKENVDLALIQTKTKIFNKPPKKMFNFSDNNPNILENPKEHKERDIKNPIKVNDDVFMIGYNRGFILANTKQGIKSQFTSGKISQENDGERILYTIPTLEGSSGSPIIDKWGNLVGVNFAKLSNSQGFSFGIPIYEVKKFYEE